VTQENQHAFRPKGNSVGPDEPQSMGEGGRLEKVGWQGGRQASGGVSDAYTILAKKPVVTKKEAYYRGVVKVVCARYKQKEAFSG